MRCLDGVYLDSTGSVLVSPPSRDQWQTGLIRSEDAVNIGQKMIVLGKVMLWVSGGGCKMGILRSLERTRVSILTSRTVLRTIADTRIMESVE